MKKKNLLLSLCLLASVAVCANPYEHSVGVSAGGFNGLSYKLWKSNNFAFQFDAGVRASAGNSVRPDFSSKVSSVSKSSTWTNLTIEVIPTFLWQKSVFSNAVCEIAPYFGGGISLGYLLPEELYVSGKYKTSSATSGYSDYYSMTPCDGMGKFGIHTAMGLEVAFSKAAAICFDFKPGYGLGYGYFDGKYSYQYTTLESYMYYNSTKKKYETRYREVTSTRTSSASAFGLIHYFDWSLSVAARFYL